MALCELDEKKYIVCAPALNMWHVPTLMSISSSSSPLSCDILPRKNYFVKDN